MAIVAITILAAVSCRKQTGIPKISDPVPVTARQVNFSLYTTKDFSNDNGTIQFTATIRNATQVLWDSILPPMKIKDIPSVINKINISKAVPGNDHSQLSVGFIYYIQNVGQSWYLQTFDAGEAVKVVDYNFQ